METDTTILLLIGAFLISLLIHHYLLVKDKELSSTETYEELSSTETYDYSYECDNCVTTYDCKIPKGETVEDFLSEAKCEYCGCNIKE